MPLRMMIRSFLIALCALCLPMGALAGESPWQEVTGGKLRLISGGVDASTGTADIGLEIHLDPGWHTYWKYPGDSGIPTEVDFSTSSGIEPARLRFPAPERYDDGYATSIVYRRQVVLPIDLPVPSTSPATLRALVRLGMCSDICVPVEASLELDVSEETLAASDIGHRMMLARARLALPHPQTDVPPRILKVEREPSGEDGAALLTITAELMPNAVDADLFAYGAAGSYNGVPKREGLTENGQMRFTLSTRGLAETGGRQPLSLVLVTGGTAIEHRIDIARLPGS
ncbi:protein-disulfide reductase DsbD domain-containing protein [Stappia indica]|uniref:protein-disulfide reductase DsbD domain-containing protein n=1 Tax=Stappia indica TaxID=538381 RepID=UPI001CD3A9E2|nr:protein-disulfide reductase DsbD domain-containing protein [Stappia indica]MCA1297776.1 hypothetical protein [Stappia indica]